MLYGAAEFSRDTDLALFASPENLELLRTALRALQARRIALPPFEQQYLDRGHAVHFRSYHPDALQMRIDVMSVMRGVDPFDQLWERRNHFTDNEGESFDVLSLPDLVRAKKTQRDKDWPMIRRLIEADYVAHEIPSIEKIRFWLLESRTPGMLIELAGTYHSEVDSLQQLRPTLLPAVEGDEAALIDALEQEEKAEREADRRYWEPLRKELGELRQKKFESEEEV